MSERPHAIPERLGRYEIVERLSAGGMGEVFVARYVGPGGFVKPVALKRIHPHLAEDEQFIHMLHDEANVAAAVKHPNIVVTIDVGFEAGNHFVVMDFVSGDPLSRLVREMKRTHGVMPPWAVAWVGAQVAGALHAAHEARSLSGEPLEIIHRDVSLQNVMLSDAGHPMLFDFGVAKARQRLVQTTHGELKGKLAYMAPEILRGQPADRTVDVFSLGVVLYELLTGVAPFQRGNDLDTITALQSAPIPPPSQLRPIDPSLDAIVLAAMARDRRYRYATAAQLEQALRAWARSTNAPHEAGPVAAWLAATFPERLAQRKELLARVADRSRPPATRAAPAQPVSSPALQGGWGTTPGPRSLPTIDITLVTDPGEQTGPTLLKNLETPTGGSQVTAFGVTRVAGAGAPRSTRAVALAVGAVGVVFGGVAAFFIARGTPAPAAPALSSATAAESATAPVETSAPTPSATAHAPTASAPTASAPTASAPTASAEPPAAATAAPPRPAPRPVVARPAPAEPAARNKGRGPIVRDYQ
jgi:serine/threonine-protein kinase